MLKIETINQFLGFGSDTKRGEYHFSSGMRSVRGGIKNGWEIVESRRSSTITGGMSLVNWFAEREESSIPQIYAVDDEGTILKVQDGLDTWTRIKVPATTSYGNGLIVDQSSSQRLLYIQDEYVGSYDGTTWLDSFMDLGWSLNVPKDSDLYEDWVAICNGSTIALLNITDDSKNYAAFTLPANFTARSVKSGSNGLLIGANFNNRGVLLLWDAQSDRSIAPWIWTNGEIQAITKYKGIWIVSTGKEILLTNGYSILDTYPIFTDLFYGEPSFGPSYPSGMIVDDEHSKLFILGKIDHLNRTRQGLYFLDLASKMWEYAPFSGYTSISTSDLGTALFISSLNYKYVSYQDTSLTVAQEYIGKVNDSSNSSYFITGKIGNSSNSKKNMEAIVIGLRHDSENYLSYTATTWTVKVKLYNFERALWNYGVAVLQSADQNKLIVNRATGTDTGSNRREIGDEVTILDGASAGDIRHIVTISAADTSQETWTMDKDFSNIIEANKYFNISPLKKVGEKTISGLTIKDDRLFIPIKKTVTGRKFLAKIVLESNKDGTVPFIDYVSFIYDEFGVS